MAYKVQVIVPILCSTILDVFPVILFYRTASTLPAVAFPKKRTAFSAKLWLYCFNEGQTADPFNNLGTPRRTVFSFAMVLMYSLLDLDVWWTIISGFDFGKGDWFTGTILWSLEHSAQEERSINKGISAIAGKGRGTTLYWWSMGPQGIGSVSTFREISFFKDVLTEKRRKKGIKEI